MKAIPFVQLNETVYYEKLSNGLDIYILPKIGFNKTFVTFTTKYGSIDNQFVPLGKSEFIRVTDGIAHFLEHVLLKKENGNVFQDFSRQGAAANAFTSFTRTNYLFSCTSFFEQNLKTLIDFVQDPYFSDEIVEKEKKIIEKEIMQYDEHPDGRLYFGLIESMYKKHPVRTDITGTIESITPITKELLYTCYNTFYHPSNMMLFIAGPVDPHRVIEQVKENQIKKTFELKLPIQRKFDEEPIEVAKKKSVLSMDVRQHKCLVGIKAQNIKKPGIDPLKTELCIYILLDLLFGKSSKVYNELYTTGLINKTFSYDYTQELDFAFASVGGDTNHPNKLSNRLVQTILEANNMIFTEEHLNRAKKKRIGGFLRSLNSPEYIANQFTRYACNEMHLFDVVPTLEKITLNDIQNIIEDFIDENRISICQIVPKDVF
ncbi:EF-P 5-aminopentanol modification-associated protein YfmH [Bacillus thuringiensis]